MAYKWYIEQGTVPQTASSGDRSSPAAPGGNRAFSGGFTFTRTDLHSYRMPSPSVLSAFSME